MISTAKKYVFRNFFMMYKSRIFIGLCRRGFVRFDKFTNKKTSQRVRGFIWGLNVVKNDFTLSSKPQLKSPPVPYSRQQN